MDPDIGPAFTSLVYDISIVSFSDSVSVTDAEGGASSTSNNNASLGKQRAGAVRRVARCADGVTATSTRRVPSPLRSLRQPPPGSGNNPVNIHWNRKQHRRHIRSRCQLHIYHGHYRQRFLQRKPRRDACSNTTTAAGVSTIQDQAATGSLDSYVGGGTVNVSRTAPTLSASQGTGVFNGAETTQYNLVLGRGPQRDVFPPVACQRLPLTTARRSTA